MYCNTHVVWYKYRAWPKREPASDGIGLDVMHAARDVSTETLDMLLLNQSPTGRLNMPQPEIQNLPGTLAAKLEMALARGQIKPVDFSNEVVEPVVLPKVTGINPIIAMREHKAKKDK